MARRKKLVLASVLILIVIVLSVVVINDSLPVYSQIKFEIANPGANSHLLNNFRTSTVKVGDIDVSYKIFGTGPPILLIMGFGGTINNWPPAFLKELSSSHTVIVFDNRGMGGTTSGIKKFSMKQFTGDTAGFLDALKIKRTDVLGASMGGQIAQELALQHPDKVGKLLLISTYCGYNESVPRYDKTTQILLRKALTNSTFLASPEGRKLLTYLSFPEEYLKQKEDILSKVLTYVSILVGYLKQDQVVPKNGQVTMLDSETLQGQLEAEQTWDGVCGKLRKINHPTLIVTGIEDIVVPSGHSLILAEKIPGARLVEIEDAGHGVIAQYPERIGKIILAFLKQGYM